MIFFLLILFLLFVPSVQAKYDPLSVPNNRFGIHIVDPNDIADAAKLTNSGGGDWGYVTLVIQEDDRDVGKWQRVMNDMRSLHLIPIVRLATHVDGDAWVKPYQDAAKDWARFLHSINWPVENRYVVVYNETNHANEWGKSLEPEEYARTLREHATKLHEASEDFFVLPAGLDASAASDARSLDALSFLRRMIAAEPALFDHLDGWTSHSYPNTAFSGSPYAIGRGTLRSYLWELTVLKNLGVTKTLPVFITETGWLHREGVMDNASLLTSQQVAANITLASFGVWRDPSIVAVTPFVLNYQGLPFDHFSWRKLGSNEFYPQYASYQALVKTQGLPLQREKYVSDKKIIPDSLVSGSAYVVSAHVKNEGQGILDGEYTLELEVDRRFRARPDPLPIIEPNQYGTLTMHLETPNAPGAYPYSLKLRHNSRDIIIESGTVTLVAPPAISIRIKLGWRKENNVPNATVLIYDHLTLIHKVAGVRFVDGKATVGELRNVVPGQPYRVVVLVPYYLPRQRINVLNKDTTDVAMPRLYPLDLDQDGALTLGDVVAVVKLQPNFIASLFVGP